MEQGFKTFINETATLKCRVCLKEMLRKSYKLHLKTFHESENLEDLTPFGQSKITDMFKKKSPMSPDSSREAGLDDKTVETESDSVEAVEHSVEYGDSDRKRKHESGYSGVGEPGQERCSTSKKVREVLDDSEKVTNKDLNQKLEKILKSVEELKDKRNVEPPKKALVTKPEDSVLLKKIKYSRSIEDILDSGFSYDNETEILSCSVCGDKSVSGEFPYSAENGLEFEDNELLPREFSNLKRTVCLTHRCSQRHR